jgi:niacin transporter
VQVFTAAILRNDEKRKGCISMKMNQTKKLTVAGMCIALGIVLPIAFHAIPNAGSVLLPMHIPVLLCGLLCGWPYGLACGILSPLLSSLLTGMPPAAYLPSMVCELAAYGLASGFLLGVVRTGRRVSDLYLSLVGAMLFGRIVSGVLNALVFSAGSYTFPVFLSGAFVTALPGILLQLIILPPMVLLLEKAKLLRA